MCLCVCVRACFCCYWVLLVLLLLQVVGCAHARPCLSIHLTSILCVCAFFSSLFVVLFHFILIFAVRFTQFHTIMSDCIILDFGHVLFQSIQRFDLNCPSELCRKSAKQQQQHLEHCKSNECLHLSVCILTHRLTLTKLL